MARFQYFDGSTRLDTAEAAALQALRADASALSLTDFDAAVDTSGLLEEGECLADYLRADDTTTFYVVEGPRGRLYGVRTMGFDFLFTRGGRAPVLCDGLEEAALVGELARDPMAWLLLPVNAPDATSRVGLERLVASSGEYRRITGAHGGERYQLLINGEPVCGAQIVDSVISTLYTRSDYRRQGLARRLIGRVLLDHPGLRHSDDRTKDGERFVANTPLRRAGEAREGLAPAP
ncbi:GNAT superfamily N-acetyltransferase [Natronocella acetinitrilica]|uniref:GNAT superfamily N-acetyltransferase n=1 Tax=Natronocella acetinitrilica TaxID=414046 RepID=A0AAE3KAI2_9GAMM|nr:GNAT family N-acetyltransferase [Natronocella acetinitrilica]MCP1674345.1 GNAT superfamily N-acetyltransferase [Natronocella acetinitrilica]